MPMLSKEESLAKVHVALFLLVFYFYTPPHPIQTSAVTQSAEEFVPLDYEDAKGKARCGSKLYVHMFT